MNPWHKGYKRPGNEAIVHGFSFTGKCTSLSYAYDIAIIMQCSTLYPMLHCSMH